MVHKNICVVSITEGKARKEIFSLISKAKELIKDSEEKLNVLIIGELSEEDKKNIYRCGGDNLLHCCCKDIDMAKYETITYEVYEKYKPSFLMFPAFGKEKSCAAKLAVQVKAGLIADCINMERNRKGEFVFTRTAMNDSVIAEIVCINTEVAMCTVKSGVFESNFSYGEEGEYEEVEFDLPFHENNLQLMERSLLEVNSLKREVDFSNSKIVFGIGRGVRDKETYDLIEKLANKLQGEIAGTRGLVEEGKLGRERQLGQSGISISPDVYIACGISGAVQHMVGVAKAKYIISINKDKNAPIVHYADCVIVGDCFEIISEMYKKYVGNELH